MSSLFVTFEGIEGCGKSTQIERLAKRLAKEGHETLTLREPGGTPIGEAIRDVVKFPPGHNPISPDTELLLMNASRAQLVQQEIRPPWPTAPSYYAIVFTTPHWPIRATAEVST